MLHFSYNKYFMSYLMPARYETHLYILLGSAGNRFYPPRRRKVLWNFCVRANHADARVLPAINHQRGYTWFCGLNASRYCHKSPNIAFRRQTNVYACEWVNGTPQTFSGRVILPSSPSQGLCCRAIARNLEFHQSLDTLIHYIFGKNISPSELKVLWDYLKRKIRKRQIS